MLDGWLRRLIDPPLRRAGRGLAAAGVSADAVTGAGFGLGLLCALCVAVGADLAALALLGLSRLCDGLDGAVAEATRRTDRGGFLDIVLDFAFYGAIPFAFVLRDPDANGISGALLLLAFYVNGGSFLAFAAVAAKRGLESRIRGVKSIYFTAGLAEGAETIVAFAAMILFPRHFPIIAFFFAGLTFMSAAARVALAWRAFRDDPDGDPGPGVGAEAAPGVASGPDGR